jgi:hypothetical protein
MAKSRSPNYPSLALPQALGHAKTMWDKEGRTSIPPAVLARHMGYSSLSGPARTRIAALKQYGLIDEGRDGLHLSDLALQIVHQPEGSPERDEAIRLAALKPDLFRELWESHKTASDEALRAYLLTRKKFTEDGAKQVIKAFRQTIELANLADSSYSPAVGTKSSEAMNTTTSQAASSSSASKGPMGQPAYSWPLSGSVVAEVRFTGTERIKPDHIEMLREYLQLAEKALARESKTDSGE